MIGRFRKVLDRVAADGEQPGVERFAPEEVEQARGLVAREADTARSVFEERWAAWDREGSVAALDRWHGWRTAGAVLDAVEVPAVPRFQVDSLLLADLHRELFAEPGVESFVYLTGQEVGPNRFTLNRCVPIEHEVQSATGAAGDPVSAIETLTELDEVGHRLLGHAHNHPGTGVAGVEPSGTDLAYQRELEEGGYTAVGLVLSEDGYVRFFTDALAVEVAVYGAHINTLESHEFTFHIEETARTAFE